MLPVILLKESLSLSDRLEVSSSHVRREFSSAAGLVPSMECTQLISSSISIASEPRGFQELTFWADVQTDIAIIEGQGGIKFDFAAEAASSQFSDLNIAIR